MHVHPAALHPLTPGSPAYTVLKLAALGSVFGLRAYLVRRDRSSGGETEEASSQDKPRRPHPVSRRKTRKRRKRR